MNPANRASPKSSAFSEMLDVTSRVDGDVRRVGFEFEFSGLAVSDAAEAVAQALGRSPEAESAVEFVVHHESFGPFRVEIDWRFLKEKARARPGGALGAFDWTELLGDLATLVVPVELVCPPIPLDRLDVIQPVVDALRVAGAMGTSDSPLAAYGLHINTEIPRNDAETIHRYLRAYCLLQSWLLREHNIDTARRLSPYVTPYPEIYLHEIHQLQSPSINTLLDHYLSHNATRNRALDMLPLFAVHEPETVRARVDDARVQARPTFHYRLPDCHIERPDWSPAQAWRRWCVIEALAQDPSSIEDLATAFGAAKRPLIGVNKDAWTEEIGEWLSDRASA